MSYELPQARHTLRLYASVIAQQKTDAVLSLLLPTGALLINVGVPYFASKTLVAIIQSSPDFERTIWQLAAVAALGALANRIGFMRMIKLQATAMNELNSMVFSRLLERGVRFHTNNIGGKLVSDALEFVGAFATLISAFYTSGLPLAVTLIGGVCVVAIESWQLGLFVLVTVVATVIWAYIESRTRYILRARRLTASKNLTAHLSDSIVNAQTVKTFANEKAERAKNANYNKVLLDLRLHDWRRAGRSGSHRISFLLVMLVVLLWLLHYLAGTTGGLLAIGIFAFTLTFQLILRLFDLNDLTRLVEEAFLQASPMTIILRESAEILDVPGAKKLHVSQGTIDMRDVTFQYEEKHHVLPVFSGLTLHIAAGEKIGLVGPSGGGKSTLSRLLLRFDDVQAGAITIDGQDIAHVTQQSLRQAIAYVPQEPLLFHRSIKENIAYGKPSASDEEIAHAARLAYANEFIERLPEKYDTVVGERGVKLSGGQRQRIAIARAILKDAPILLLDEATSALDSESEELIQKALWQLMKGRTAIVIAHRLSTIQKMDRIIVLEDGEISEQGSHQTLIEQSGTYAKLWARQSGGFLEP